MMGQRFENRRGNLDLITDKTESKCWKYKQENLWASTEGTVVLIRLSEMYYILAECAATPGEAAEFLNKVRNIRGVDPVVCTEANRLDERKRVPQGILRGGAIVFLL